MSGGVKEVLQAVEHGVVHVAKVAAWPFIHAAQLVGLIETTMRDEPEVKAALVGLISRIETLGADSTAVFAAKGLSLPADLKEFADAKELFEYVRDVFIPEVRKVYGDFAPQLEHLKAETETPNLGNPPGLHNVVPA
jgi:hypothetical protein